MTETSRPTPGPPSGADWPKQATDAIVNLVDSTKDKVNGPAVAIARGLVYGTLGGIVGLFALVLFLVLLVRGIDVGVDGLLDLAGAEKAGRSTWIAHLLTGGLFFLLPGIWAWRKATHPAPTAD